MNLSDWLIGHECDDERRIDWALQLVDILSALPDGHINPERIEVEEISKSLSLNNSVALLDDYNAPEILQGETQPGFVSAVFSYALMVDELLRGSSYRAERGWSNEEFLTAVKESDAWFEPIEDDPLADVLIACLGKASDRPQEYADLKKLLLSNDEVSGYIKRNPLHIWQNDTVVETETHQKEATTQPFDQDTGLGIGIDLGTSNSTVAYYQAGKFQYIEVHNKRAVPSAIYFKKIEQEDWLYGDRAVRRGVMYPDALFKHFKRHIGESQQLIFRPEPQGGAATITKRTYVIDTNVFIKDPHIMEGLIGDDVEILIPKIVLQELSRRKSDPKTADEAEVAQNSIEEHRNQVSMEDSHPELLSADMFQSSDRNNNDRNDSMILSVALYNDSKSTILITNDKLLTEKATWLNKHAFQVQTYEEFSFYRHVREESSNSGELKLTGQDGATFFLKYLREEIRKKIGYVNKAVITVPQEFSDFQKNEIREAGYKAGFTDVMIRPEPFAAALAYGLNQEENKKLLVYDFGGGTFDVTILEIEDGEFRRLGTGGDDKLGGEDFTRKLIEDFMDKLVSGEVLSDGSELDMYDEEASGLSHEEFVKNKLKIWEACEDIKCRLSVSDEEMQSIELYVHPGERQNVSYSLNKEQFQEITADLMAKATKALDKALQLAGLKRGDIDVVIMAGGTSTIPSIKEMVHRYFGKKPYADRDPATLIAEGAAIFADIKWNQNSTIDKQIRIFDKTVSDLGVTLKNRDFDVIIPAASTLPTQKEKIYALVEDGQENLEIDCFSREEGSQAANTYHDTEKTIKYIGKVRISQLPPLKRDEVDVCVTFCLTKEYELDIEVNLRDKQGKAIKAAAVKIEAIGV